jgi:hypothetical protein
MGGPTVSHAAGKGPSSLGARNGEISGAGVQLKIALDALPRRSDIGGLPSGTSPAQAVPPTSTSVRRWQFLMRLTP